MILSELTQIRRQNRVLLITFSNLNKEKIDECVDRLAVALEKFNVNYFKPTLFSIYDSSYV